MKQTNRLKRMVVLTGILSSLFFQAFAAGSYVNPRVSPKFNLDWKYSKSNTTGAEGTTFNDGSWESVAIPHNTKWMTTEDKAAYLGISWYRKHFTVDNAMQGKKAFIEFEAAMQTADVYVNGTLVGSHVGGYMGFTFDITSKLVYGAENVLAVKVNSNASVDWAPGDAVWLDFQFMGGLYRDVNLYFTDKLHVTDPIFANKVAGGGVFVSYPTVSTASASVSIKTNVINENAAAKTCTIVSDIVDANGVIAKSDTKTQSIAAGADYTFAQSVTIDNPKLWHPNTPNLYTLNTTIKDGETVVDYYKTRIGIRTITWSNNKGVVINGVGFKAQGNNMHQDIFGIGNAVPKQAIYYDMKRFKEAGLNFVRGSHYPHNTAFYDACDELGILVENSMTGWQHFYNTDVFKNNTYKEVREMIRRDRNHPSVAVWETQINEASYSAAWATTMNDLAHVEFGDAKMFTCGTGGGMATYASVTWDVMIGASQHGTRKTTTTQPVILCEYGSWDYGGETSTSDVVREGSEAALLVQCNNIQESLNMNRALSWYSADAYWVYADYPGYITAGYPTNRLNSCGIVDYYRIPKPSYYFFQSQRDPNVILPNVNSGPMVNIASKWATGSSGTVRVFSNCDKVSLYKDNTLIATKSPDNGANTASLSHPPFTFTVGSFSAGTLRAVGTIGTTEKAWDTVRTPQAAKAVRLRAESYDSLQPGGSDLRLIWIDIVDDNGTVVPTSNVVVTVSATGGSIVGPTSLTMKGGQLATWVKGGATFGKIVVSATSGSLSAGADTLNADKLTGLQSALKTVVPAKIMSSTQRVFGNKFIMPKDYAGRNVFVAVYNLNGKLVGQKLCTKNIVDIRKDFGAPEAAYVVKVKTVK